MVGEKVLVQLYFCSIFLFKSCCSNVDVQATDHRLTDMITNRGFLCTIVCSAEFAIGFRCYRQTLYFNQGGAKNG